MQPITFETTIRRGFPVQIAITVYEPEIVTLALYDPGELEFFVRTTDGRDAGWLNLTPAEHAELSAECIEFLTTGEAA